MSRGAREGNNALLKGMDEIYANMTDRQISSFAMEQGLSKDFIKSLVVHHVVEQSTMDLNNVDGAIRNGHWQLASDNIESYFKRFGYGERGFSKFHHEALSGPGWKDNPRESSATKTSEGSSITPLHCACINPDHGALTQLYTVAPEAGLADSKGRKLVHFAAASENTSALDFLVSVGANLEDKDTEGMTPLMVAAELGRIKNVEFIIEKVDETNKRLQDNDALAAGLKKFGKAGIDRQAKTSWTALFFAVANGHLDVVKILFHSGADHRPNKDGKTPLDYAKELRKTNVVAILEQHLQEQDDLKNDNDLNLLQECQNLKRLLQEVTAERDALRVSVEQMETTVNELEMQCVDLQDERDTLGRELRIERGQNEVLVRDRNVITGIQELQEALRQWDAAQHV